MSTGDIGGGGAGRLRRALAPFDPRGRLCAPAYRLIVIRLVLAFAGLVCLSVWLGGHGLRGLAILAAGGTLFVALAACAQTIRRLHDRDRTAWWLGLYILLEAVSTLPLEQFADSDPVPVFASVAAMLGYFAWFFIETVLRPGTPGPNRHGPAPIAPP
ncbi:DUF805 domain-containing protein [Methylobacterium sp. J-068]|uniref:DUF805 domain-containing protein n=1 Tax=Methylobacterium sp. J-068 TaxID=2836649 RepID=UPI001FB8EEB5|nr:DUF805 domain-containing protein [Methylobacterium sp. J-068]MCJ2035060.1 DUF805 domain-containing protein [Methylobacterium sp. J-068]